MKVYDLVSTNDYKYLYVRIFRMVDIEKQKEEDIYGYTGYKSSLLESKNKCLDLNVVSWDIDDDYELEIFTY